ncbi:histidine kinase [Kaistia algarum]|uniref:Hpt domain-containing protein n=1 Tax=Kaistia algarum TaxID=2083279 RepID=UPI000CE829E4|nr:Hpt domain-containing protein [Kaistia algarum]MCX5516020.1 Hpt domain-containing protein [Kaistia algarum]PPE80629.1 histidine kinase [Kaistia algarum]
MGAEPPIDESALDWRTGGDEARARGVLGLFRDEILDDAFRLADEMDLASRLRLAHKVKGAALAIGADRVAGLAEFSEERGEAFRAALTDLQEAIDARLASA